MNAWDHIAELLASRSGFEAASVGTGHLQAAVRKRLRATSLDSETAYRDLLVADSAELDALVEAIVVPETRFFRDAAVFQAAGDWAADWARAHPSETLRVLSMPCASGEEAWSLAACLTEKGVAPERLLIEAEDISTAALETARRGLYQAGSFRGVPHAQRSHFARETPEGWSIHEALRPLVVFRKHNILDEPDNGRQEPYHLVFCRNLLIYLHQEARVRVIGILHRLLHPQGRLVIGSGDFLPELLERFAPIRPAASFALTPHRLLTLSVPSRDFSAIPPVPSFSLPAVPPLKNAPPDMLYYERARVFLQNGDPHHAERSCRQALYVNPTHVPSLELLSELWDQQASPRLRKALHGRLHRARSGVSP